MLTVGQVFPSFACQLCMHMGAFAKWKHGTCTHKTALQKISDKLGNIKQATLRTGDCTPLNLWFEGWLNQFYHILE